MASLNKDIVLAFSGGLDTSFCVPYLIEQGYRVITVFVDTGGVSPDEGQAIQQRALDLGAARHIDRNAAQELWSAFVVPFVKGGAPYQDQYPLLCSDRYLIVSHMAAIAKELGTNMLAHGCTAMGNDQVRFDVSIRALGDFEIIAPIREIQSLTSTPRAFEEAYLAERGFSVDAKTSKYTINENLLGATISGSEIDELKPPSVDSHCITAPPSAWPRETRSISIAFHEGRAVGIDGTPMTGPDILKTLNSQLGEYGVGRGMYAGDTMIGLKGRIVYECPGLTALLVAHRALEELTLTKAQNRFKPEVGRAWTRLVYEGLFHEPLARDLEVFLDSTQQHVTGVVQLETSGGNCHAVAVDSPHVLARSGATYAQGSDWSAEEAQGFIKLFGQSTTIAHDVHRQPDIVVKGKRRDMVNDVLSHLGHLVGFDTQNPPRAIAGDHEIFAYVSSVMEACGFSCSIDDLGDGSVNLIAKRGEPNLLFNVHLDTVPGGGSWTHHPWSLDVRDGRAVGLGACDIKGAAACLLTAMQSTSAPCAILLTSDEEAGQSRCVRTIAPELSAQYQAVVVAEPTMCHAVGAHRGLVVFEVEFRGEAGHSSAADAFDGSAIHRMTRWAQSALTWAKGLDSVSAGSQQGIRFNVGVIEGGTKANVVASHARLVAGFRPLPSQNSRSLITQMLDHASLSSQDVARTRFAGPALSSSTESMDLVTRLNLTPAPPVDFWTEASLFAEAGLPAIVFGPGDIAQAHTADEWVELEQLELAAKTYIAMIEGSQ